MKRLIIPVVLLFIISLFQVSFATVFRSLYFYPNILFLVSLALFYSGNEKLSVISFFLSGLFLDLLGTHPFGLLTLVFTGLGSTSILITRLLGSNIILALFTSALGSVILRVISSGFYFNTGIVIYEAVINVITFIIIFPVVRYLSSKFIKGEILQLRLWK